MKTISVREARAALYNLIDEMPNNYTPIVIAGKLNSAVLISAADWASIQETLYLLSVPSVAESIQEGMNTPLDECDTELRW